MSRIPDFSSVAFQKPALAPPRPNGDVWRTPEGVSVKNVYTGADLADLLDNALELY